MSNPSTRQEGAATPGPWEYVVKDDGLSCQVEIEIRMDSRLGGANGWESQHSIVYEVPAPEESPEQFAEAEAKARLIAAAPDLLLACKTMLKWLTDDGLTSDLASAAIAKAEGQS